VLGEGDTPNPLAVPGENPHLLVNLRMPQPDHAIFAAAGEREAIRRKPDGFQEADFLRTAGHESSRDDVPHADQLLRAAGGKEFAVAGNCQGLGREKAFDTPDLADEPSAAYRG